MKRLLSILGLALALGLILWPLTAIAQTASLLPNGRQQFFDANGNPLAGGSVSMFVPPNTTTPKTTWQDAARSTPNAAPIALDSAGTALIYGVGGYRQMVYDALGNLIWDAQTSASGSGGGGATFVGTSTGTANSQVLPVSTFSGINGEQLAFIAGFTNTGAMTLNAGTGIWPLVMPSSQSLPQFQTMPPGAVTTGNYVLVAWDATNSQFQLLNGAPNVLPYTLRVLTALSDPSATFTSTDGSALPGPAMIFDRASPSPVALDSLGVVSFTGRNTSSATVDYGKVGVIARDVSAAPVGVFSFNVAQGASGSVDALYIGQSADGTVLPGQAGLVGLPKGQLSFPAVQNPAAGFYTLDDYREGIWVPTISFGGANVGVTYLSQNGKYTKIGNVVCAAAAVYLTAKGSSVGNVRIGGLPFTSNASMEMPFSVAVASNFTGLTGALTAFVEGSSNSVLLEQSTATGSAPITNTSLTNTTGLNVGGCYWSSN